MSYLPQLILAAPLILFSLAMHEFAHGLTSVRLGDPTPEKQGRLTLNPLAHLDPLGTLMIILTMLGGIGFGWARPVQIDPSHYKNPERGAVLVALAGPFTNFVLAVFLGYRYACCAWVFFRNRARVELECWFCSFLAPACF